MVMEMLGKFVTLSALIFLLNFFGNTQVLRAQGHSAQQNAEPVVLVASVENKAGNLVIELHQDNFQVFIDNKPANIVAFHDEDVPMSIGIVFDTSASVGFSPRINPVVRSSQQGLKTFLDNSHKENEYFLMAFNISPEILLDWTSDTTAIINALGVVKPKGNTAFFDACYLALNKVRQGRHAKRVLIVISDGADNTSRYTANQLRDELKASGVLFYSLNVSGANLSGSSLADEGQAILDELSDLSGGRAFYQRYGKPLTKSDLSSAVEIIAAELRHQYTLAVAPTVVPNDDKWHKLKIKVQGSPEMKHFTARAREGFYLNRQ